MYVYIWLKKLTPSLFITGLKISFYEHDFYAQNKEHRNTQKRSVRKDLFSSKWKSLSRVPLFAIPWSVAHQASLSTGFSIHRIFQARVLEPVSSPAAGFIPSSRFHPQQPVSTPAAGFNPSSRFQPQKPVSLGIFLIQGLNPGLPHCRQILYHLSHQGSPLFQCSSQSSNIAYFKSVLFFSPTFWTSVFWQIHCWAVSFNMKMTISFDVNII